MRRASLASSVGRLGRFGLAFPIAAAVIVALMPWLGLGLTIQRELQLAAIYALIVAGFNIGYGYGGQLALGQVAVFAGGAYVTAILYNHGVTELTIAIVASVAFAGLLGLITGLPGLRFADWSLALVAFFLVLLIPNITDLLSAQTGGVIGIPGIQGPTLFGQALSAKAFYVVTIVVSALVLLLYRNLVKSRYGNGLLVLRHGQALARSVGLSPYRLRLSAYLWSALPAGLAGAFYAYFSSYIQAGVFDFSLVTLMLAASALGGTRSIWAAPIACAILVVGPDQVAAFDKYSVLAYGVLLMVVGVGFAAGLAGVGDTALARFSGRLRPRSQAADVASDGAAGAGRSDSPDPLAIAGASLSTRGVSKAFGGVRALCEVDFDARQGEITAIIGANGAGKTTLLNAISGLIPLDSGEVRLGEEVISRLAADRIARAGVSRTFQTPQVPDTLSVLDVAASSRISRRRLPSVEVGLRSPRYWKVQRQDLLRARAALAFVGLEHDEQLPAVALPLGRRRILEVARSIAAEPAAVLFDEPAAGLDQEALESLAAVLRKLRDERATVVLIEHNVRFVMDVADTVYVMELGSVIASGPPEVVRRDEAVIASYLGHRHAAPEGPAAEVREPAKVGDGD
ncbi:MAG TPA: branched-chain amino acid ABC transporter ATP-binding protein/permease [Solirubrobacteraceae bacterium]|nr:branched-chain amino acid ABC transporter ATP-binding protein/permease [Solirubrobacteraceae bacterium]